MPLFHTRVAQQFQTRLADLFTPAGLYYVQLPDAAAVVACFMDYTQAFVSTSSTKQLATITLPDAGIVPYLTVRSNMLINGQHHPFTLVPEALRKDTLFLDGDATALTAVQKLYIQLFRGLLAGRQFLLMSDFPAAMTPQETRLFLNCAQTAVKAAGASMIILTTDTGLIAANPDTSWSTPPQLNMPSATA